MVKKGVRLKMGGKNQYILEMKDKKDLKLQ